MFNVYRLIILGVQAGFSFVVLFCVFMFFALSDYKGGFDNFVGLTIFQPLWAALFSSITIAICFVIGLPLRLNIKWLTWWSNRFYIPIALINLGTAFCVLSLIYTQHYSYRIEGVNHVTTAPNTWLSVSGWFILGFSTLHLFPPMSLFNYLAERFTAASARKGL